MTYIAFLKKFPNDKACADHFFKIRYQKGLKCPHCGETKRVARRSDNIRKCACYNCNNSFSMFKGTIFEKSSTSLQVWFFSIHFILNAKKGFSALQLHREIGGSYKTAWRIWTKVREAMGNVNHSYLMHGEVEVDETYVGGKPRKINEYTDDEVQKEYLEYIRDDNRKRLQTGKKLHGGNGKRGHGSDKFGVIGAYERSTGKVTARLLLPNKKGETLSSTQFLKFINDTVDCNTKIFTDDSRSYSLLNLANQEAYDKALKKGNPIPPVFRKSNYKNLTRVTVNHKEGTFSNGAELNTNAIEWLWSMVKRSIYGTYHHITFKYAQGYMDEICFRQNHRWCAESMFDLLVQQTINAKSRVVEEKYLERYRDRNLKNRAEVEALVQKALDAVSARQGN